MPEPTLTTLAEFKTHLGLTDDCDDPRLAQYLVGTEEAVKRYCGRDFVSAAATEYYDGHGGQLLDLRRRPVTAVASVHVDQGGYYGQADGAFPADTEWTVGVDFVIRRTDATEGNGGLLLAINRCWPEGQGNIKVVNTAGYVTIPEDLKLAVHMLGAVVRDAAASGKIKGSETIGRYSYTLISTGDGRTSGGDGGASVVAAREILSYYTDLSL